MQPRAFKARQIRMRGVALDVGNEITRSNQPGTSFITM
jgi:hypothetical protein